MTTHDLTRMMESQGGPPALRMLFMELAYRADRHGVIRYTQTEIAATIGISRQQVAAYMRAMVEVGCLEHEHQGRYKFSKDFFDPDPEFWRSEIGVDPPTLSQRIEDVRNMVVLLRGAKHNASPEFDT